MKIWTYQEAVAKIELDLDLEDEDFAQPMEIVGYFNEGIKVAEAAILKIDEDYFLTKYPMPLVQGQTVFTYPWNIYAYKIRGIEYANGPIIYPVTRIRRKDKFNEIAFSNIYNEADDYRYYTQNDGSDTGATIILTPPSRETAVLAYPYSTSSFAPMWMWFIRHANRVPVLGEYVPNYEMFMPASVNTGTSAITLNKSYVTGDQVKITSTGAVPGGLTSGTIYFAIVNANQIKFATTLQNAQAGTSITLTSIGAGILSVAVVATQSIINNVALDIPEYIEFIFQFVRCRIYEKEGDARLTNAKVDLQNLYNDMVATLTEKEPDDDNRVQPDLSSYYQTS